MTEARRAVIDVHVQPRAKRTEVVGTYGDRLKIRLAAAPMDGAANEELIRFLAEQLHVARSTITLVGGLTSRSKRIRVDGMTEHQVRERLWQLSLEP